jgi:hypothetical protein
VELCSPYAVEAPSLLRLIEQLLRRSLLLGPPHELITRMLLLDYVPVPLDVSARSLPYAPRDAINPALRLV